MIDKFRLVYGIGITGHVHIDSESISPIIRKIFSVIKEQYLSIYEEYSDCFSGDGLYINSCLAYGTDQLAAREALSLGYRLNAFLPFDLRDSRTKLVYGSDVREEFNSSLQSLINKADSVLELSPLSECFSEDKESLFRHKAFFSASNTMLNNSEILIAIWNGQESEAIGGTYQTIQSAIKLNKALITVSPDTPSLIHRYDYETQSFTELLEDEIASFIYDSLIRVTPPHDKCLNILNSISSRLRVPPFWAKWSRVYNWLSPKIKNEIKESDSKQYAPPQNVLTETLNKLDSLSGYYAELFRTFFVLAPIIGLLTVTLSALGLVVTNSSLVLLLSILALILLFSYWGIYLFKEHYSWHTKLTEYRTLAETLRTQIYLLQVGQSSVNNNILSIYDLSEFKWQQNLIRIIVRGQGLPKNINWNNDKSRIKALLCSWIDGQIKYHDTNYLRTRYANSRLNKWSTILFVLTVLLVILNVVIAVPFELSNTLKMLPITLGLLGILAPLYATGIDAISKYAEFSLLAERSYGLAKTLSGFLKELEQEDIYENISLISSRCGQLMLNETLEWNIHYRRIEIQK